MLQTSIHNLQLEYALRGSKRYWRARDIGYTAYAIHASGGHPAYCRAPPLLEQHLVGLLLRATCHPPHDGDAVTLGGGTTLGRGVVELIIGAASSTSTSACKKNTVNENTAGKKKKHHTNFQENFTIQLSGIKRWTLRRGRVRHPLCGTTPQYARNGEDVSVAENQL